MKLFFDTNVIVYEASSAVLRLVDDREVIGALPSSSLTDVSYLCRKNLEPPKLRHAIKYIMAVLDIVALTREDCEAALDLPMGDFEDAIIARCAQKWNADFIITRDTGDFKRSQVPALAPYDFLAKSWAGRRRTTVTAYSKYLFIKRGMRPVAFEFKHTDLADAFLIDCFWAPDARGGFVKYFEREIFAKHGITFNVSEIFSTVNNKNVIRAMHFQRPAWQAKIVTVLHGAIFDVIVDLRRGSPTYLKNSGGAMIRAQDRRALYVPKGFAHGYLVCEDDTVVTYICDGKFVASDDTGIRWNDPTLGIKWPIDGEPILSDKDRGLPLFSEELHAYI